jgi:hypothetical protein
MQAAALRIGNLLNHAELGRDAKMPLTFCSEYAAEALGGVILHGGDESYWLGDNILAAP